MMDDSRRRKTAEEPPATGQWVVGYPFNHPDQEVELIWNGSWNRPLADGRYRWWFAEVFPEWRPVSEEEWKRGVVEEWDRQGVGKREIGQFLEKNHELTFFPWEREVEMEEQDER